MNYHQLLPNWLGFKAVQIVGEHFCQLIRSWTRKNDSSIANDWCWCFFLAMQNSPWSAVDISSSTGCLTSANVYTHRVTSSRTCFECTRAWTRAVRLHQASVPARTSIARWLRRPDSWNAFASFAFGIIIFPLSSSPSACSVASAAAGCLPGRCSTDPASSTLTSRPHPPPQLPAADSKPPRDMGCELSQLCSLRIALDNGLAVYQPRDLVAGTVLAEVADDLVVHSEFLPWPGNEALLLGFSHDRRWC